MSRFRTLTAVTVIATIVLIAIGSLVRTSGSGLGCPDWPLCHGRPLPPLERTAIIEWSHRTAAAIVGLLIVVQAAWALVARRQDTMLVTLAVLSLPLLVVQALLGAVTVRFELPPEIVAVHLTTAFGLLAVLTVMAACASLGAGRTRIVSRERQAFERVALWATAGTAVVLLIGAYTVATDAGFGCTTWPSCREAQIPFFSGERLQHIHWLHRVTVGAGAALIAWLFLHVRDMRDRGSMLRRGAHTLIGLYAVQIVIGGLNILTAFSGVALVSHLAVASAIWVVMILIAYAGRFQPEPAPESGGAPGAP